MLELKIGMRFLKEGRMQTLLILLGISAGVAVQVFLGSLITSLQEDLINRTIGTSPHITIAGAKHNQSSLRNESSVATSGNIPVERERLRNYQQITELLDKNESITAVSPVVSGSGFAMKSGDSTPVTIKGVSIERADRIYDISERLAGGRFDVSGSSVLIGTALAKKYGIEPGASIMLRLPSGVSSDFTVSGIFDLESEAVNEGLVFMDIKRAQSLFGSLNYVTQIELQVEDVFAADSIDKNIAVSLPDAGVNNWKDENASLLTALRSQSSSSYTIQAFVIAAVALGISSVLAVSVVQKSKEIGILKAMGMRPRSIARVFLLQGAILGTAGSAIGIVLGIILIEGFILGTSLQSGQPTFDIRIRPLAIIGIAAIALITGTLSALIPARRSAGLDPIEVIRNG
ncbi:ABC-type transport system [Peptoclostridium acidaminophilum DSM 3953]|uniref:ABC-type transport system n=1 Tax=Peptoclostridium acidaminophilum DSM 3953 TaxID=1286171 RepID=W8TMH4_PEPAC|nr:FtsX-like permease family protein [Peptoclostridium acidaminophilum]AHM57407.1 ABC-type transport system [Peptoclostridium acidaminophilum DSM 3953]